LDTGNEKNHHRNASYGLNSLLYRLRRRIKNLQFPPSRISISATGTASASIYHHKSLLQSKFIPQFTMFASKLSVLTALLSLAALGHTQ
jgi:hypothetical protein